MAQTSNGYLWLGTGDGLYRFDGVRFARIVPDGARPPHTDIVALFATKDDDLLIGYQDGGVSLLSNNRLSNLAGFSSATVNKIVEDADNRIWVLCYTILGRGALRRLSHGKWEQVTAGLPPDAVASDIAVDPAGQIWVLTSGTLYILPRGATAFSRSSVDPFQNLPQRPEFEEDRQGRIAFSRDSSLWFVQRGKARRLSYSTLSSHPRSPPQLSGKAIFTGTGDLWATAPGHGIIYLSEMEYSASQSAALALPVESFSRPNGLSSDITGTVFEDREQNIWVGTNMGLDRFHAASVIPETSVNLTSSSGYRMAPAADAAFYLIQSRGLYLLYSDGRLVTLEKNGVLQEAFCPDGHDGIWLASDLGFRHWSGSVAKSIDLPDGVRPERITACQKDGIGRLWLAVANKGIFRQEGSNWQSLPAYSNAELSPAMLVASGNSEMWLVLPDGPIQLITERQVRTFGRNNGLDVGDVETITLGSQGTLVGGESGLAWLDGSRFRTIRSDTESPFRRIAGIWQTSDGETWLNTLSGAIVFRSDDLQAAFLSGQWPNTYTVFDRHDGLPGLAQQDSYAPTVLQGSDNRLWFITNQGIAWIDPHRLPTNPVVPPVIIEDLVSDYRHYPASSGLTLPAGTSEIQIDYTAPSLRTPERVAFRYKLEGVDEDWVDPGHRRQAFYTRLGPGHYTFQVKAANDSGLWNDYGATLHFAIRPRFTETVTFTIICFVAASGLLASFILVNLQRVSRRLQERMGERLRERERIARELHDTLLQGFQGLQLHLQSAMDALPTGVRSRHLLEQALSLADTAIRDARLRVRDLRSSSALGGLSQHLRLRGENLLGSDLTTLRLSEKGRARDLNPDVEREVAAIAEEAIFNAIKHANSTVISVSILYGWWRFRLIVSDDGKGIDDALVRGTVIGHFGLLGIQERARRLRGKLLIRRPPAGGTRVELAIPAIVSYGGRSWVLPTRG